MSALLIRGLWGLGDNIYSRPFIRSTAKRHEVWLETPWPEIFEDLPIHFVRAERRLRTQMRNVNRQTQQRWSVAPRDAREIRLIYGHAHLATGSIIQALEKMLPLSGDVLSFDLPDMGPSPLSGLFAIIRPATVRSEWRNPARNPLPEYIGDVASWLSSHRTVCLADLSPQNEWLVGGVPRCDNYYLQGELDVRKLLALTAAADVLVGGVGWIVPAALALKRKAFIILGGQGGHNSPEKVLDPRIEHQIGFAVPDRFCRCTNMQHNCAKTISNLHEQFLRWACAVGLSENTNAA